MIKSINQFPRRGLSEQTAYAYMNALQRQALHKKIASELAAAIVANPV